MDDVDKITMDNIVDSALEHRLELDASGQPDLRRSAVVAGVVFASCTKGCNVSVGVYSFDQDVINFRVSEAERRHQLYVATADAYTRTKPAVVVDEMVPFGEADFERAKAVLVPRPGDPCPTCGMPMVKHLLDDGVECPSDHK